VLLGSLLLVWVVSAAEFRKLSEFVTARDGVKLATDIYLPPGDGPFPTILARTPYNKGISGGLGEQGTKRGLAVVIQDTRGRFASEGKNLPFHTDGWGSLGDGQDTVDWIKEQVWYGGKLGTHGGSAGAITQFMLSGSGTTEIDFQHLVVGTPSLFHNGIYQGGVFRKALVERWLAGAQFDPEALENWIQHSSYDSFWMERDLTTRYDKVNWPAVHIGGWFDIFSQSTIDAYLGYNERGGPNARGAQRLIMGPWTHGVLQPKAGELSFPGANVVPGDAAKQTLYWDRYLKHPASRQDALNGVLYYVMGDVDDPSAPGNEWRQASSWPPFETKRGRVYLTANKTLSRSLPIAASSALSYQYDPNNPVPTVGGPQLTIPSGPRDQRVVEERDDVLVFSSQVLEKPLEVTGRVSARFWIKSTGVDTDFFARLCDVYPDGRSFNLCEGVLRTRFREGFDREVLMIPGTVYPIDIDLWSTSVVFAKGHRLRLQVTSSSDPGYAPNSNTGARFRASRELKTVTNTIYLDASHPSHLDLPLPPGQELILE
jgi:predicted acyl esterase